MGKQIQQQYRHYQHCQHHAQQHPTISGSLFCAFSAPSRLSHSAIVLLAVFTRDKIVIPQPPESAKAPRKAARRLKTSMQICRGWKVTMKNLLFFEKPAIFINYIPVTIQSQAMIVCKKFTRGRLRSGCPFFVYAEPAAKKRPMIQSTDNAKNRECSAHTEHSLSLVSYSIVRMLLKPVTSKTSIMVWQTFLSTIFPCLFICFCADSSTRSPAEER